MTQIDWQPISTEAPTPPLSPRALAAQGRKPPGPAHTTWFPWSYLDRHFQASGLHAEAFAQSLGLTRGSMLSQWKARGKVPLAWLERALALWPIPPGFLYLPNRPRVYPPGRGPSAVVQAFEALAPGQATAWPTTSLAESKALARRIKNHTRHAGGKASCHSHPTYLSITRKA